MSKPSPRLGGGVLRKGRMMYCEYQCMDCEEFDEDCVCSGTWCEVCHCCSLHCECFEDEEEDDNSILPVGIAEEKT